MSELTGKKIAFLVADEGVEQIELTEPWKAVEQAGGTPRLVAPTSGMVQAFNHLDRGDRFTVDLTLAQARAHDFDALVLPGGVANPDILRTIPEAVALIKAFTTLGLPIAAICHAPWTLVEAEVVAGKQLTSWPSLRTDIINAGGRWVDEQVVICTDNDYTLVTSRKPDDLPAFTKEFTAVFAESNSTER